MLIDMSNMHGTGVDPQALREQQIRQQACLDSAIFAGLKASTTSLVVSGGLVAGLTKYSDVSVASVALQQLQLHLQAKYTQGQHGCMS